MGIVGVGVGWGQEALAIITSSAEPQSVVGSGRLERGVFLKEAMKGQTG